MTKDLTAYKIKDLYTGRLIKVKTVEELKQWLWDNNKTQSDALYGTIEGLVNVLENDQDFKWYAAANMISMERPKGRRKK